MKMCFFPTFLVYVSELIVFSQLFHFKTA